MVKVDFYAGRRALLGVAIGLLASGCARAQTSLTIEITRGPEHPPERYILNCNPPGGSLAAAPVACERLAAAADDPFAPVPGNVACLTVMAGSGVATVRGVYRGRQVEAMFHGRNSCEAQRYTRLMGLLGLPG